MPSASDSINCDSSVVKLKTLLGLFWYYFLLAFRIFQTTIANQGSYIYGKPSLLHLWKTKALIFMENQGSYIHGKPRLLHSWTTKTLTFMDNQDSYIYG